MDRKTVIPPEIELELKKFELKISKLNKEEMFKELMLLKFCLLYTSDAADD